MTKLLRCGAILACCAAIAFAVDWKAYKPEGYVSDFARVVDAQDKERLERYCYQLEQQAGVQMALVTMPSLEGEPVADVANTLFRAWGIGKKGKDEGVLLLLVTGERRSRLEVGYGLEPIIPDGFDGSVLREMRPALRQGQYGAAFLAAAQTIGSRIAQAKNISLQPLETPRRARPSPAADLPWPLILGGGLFLLFLLMRAGRQGRGGPGAGGGGFLPGLLLGNMLGGGGWGGGRSSGGFGGFDSGGGFGGFGGGDSGGGGASSSW